jgi:hypothetical protein
MELVPGTTPRHDTPVLRAAKEVNHAPPRSGCWSKGQEMSLSQDRRKWVIICALATLLFVFLWVLLLGLGPHPLGPTLTVYNRAPDTGVIVLQQRSSGTLQRLVRARPEWKTRTLLGRPVGGTYELVLTTENGRKIGNVSISATEFRRDWRKRVIEITRDLDLKTGTLPP